MSQSTTSRRSDAQIDLEERRQIDRMAQSRVPIDEIAARLGRHRSTIYRELKRNRLTDTQWPDLNGYYAMTANDVAGRRRKRLWKLVRNPELRTAVIDRLKAGWSPEQIAGRLCYEHHSTRVCHETIYRYAYGKDGQAQELYRHLPEHRRRRRPRNMRGRRGPQLPDRLALRHRPDVVKQREQFGHWEGDLVMFRKEYGKANLTTLVERVTRFTVILPNDDRRSKPVMGQMVDGLAALPHEARRSLTFDRGTEFSAWKELRDGLGADVWFCDPHAPWQRGTNENTNRRLRRFLPRSTDPLSISLEKLASVTKRLNETPRKCLGYRTPSEAFREEMEKTATFEA